MKAAWTVLKKELLDLFRDRRTVMISLLMGPLLGPALMVGLITLIASKEVERAEKPLKLPVIGAEHAPNLVDWLGTMNVEIEDAPADPDAAIRGQDKDVILRITAEYAEAWRKSRPAPIELLYDSTRQDARMPLRRVEGLLETYDRQMGALRLVARGINPAVGTPVLVQHRDLSTPQSRAGMLLAFLPYILILSAFLGGAQLAVDATAGERERQSLEPLLATPAARDAIMSGKLGAATAFALLSAFLTLLSFKGFFSFVPASMLGFKIDISWLAMAKLLAIVFPVAVFGSCLVTLLAATTKSTKEAQSYMNLLMLLPMLPSLILLASPVKHQTWMSAVPLLAQNQAIQSVVRGEPIGIADWALIVGAGLLLAAGTWLISARLYRRESLAISA